MNQSSDFLPAARQTAIIQKEVDGELLIYDLTRDKAHCLNASAAAIWKRCDGHTSAKEIAASLTKEVGVTVGERVVWLALAELRRTHLLEESREETGLRRAPSGVKPPDKKAASSRRTPKVEGMSRREVVRRIGFGAAIALPVVISITAPTAAQASSCLQTGATTMTSAECCSGALDQDGKCV